MINETFAPAYTQGQTVAGGATTASIEIGKGSKSLTLTNTGAVIMYVATGDSTVEASADDYALLPLSQVSISKSGDHTHLAYIGNTGALHAIPGEGF